MSPINRELLEKYLKGDCAQEEEAVVHHWLDDNDLNDYPAQVPGHKTIKKRDKNWSLLTEKVEELKVVAPPRQRANKWFWMAAAIAVMIVAAVSVWPYLNYGRRNINYKTTYGEIKKITLPDGTTVTLNAQSSLSIRQDYGKEKRNVYLSGEAYFQVKHQADKEFTVHAGKISVTVLGTAFDVSAFSDDPRVAVSLKEGKVLVETGEHGANKQQNALLKPGEQAIFTKSTASLNVSNLNPKLSFGWETQDIVFENADIDEVLRKLQRYYGVTFDTGLLKQRHWQLTGEYKNETLAEVLESLSFNYNLKYTIEGNRVVLYER